MSKIIALFFLVAALTVLGCLAEPPQVRRYRTQRLEATTSTESETEETTTAYAAAGFQPGREFNEVESATGPYAPSGWKPSGQRLTVPVAAPQQTYGSPSLVYGAPAVTPPPSTEEDAEDIEAVTKKMEGPQINETTDEPDSEVLPAQSQSSNTAAKQQAATAPGLYFVQLPDGSVQQFIYYAAPEAASVAAKLQAAQPILQAQPIFYNPLFGAPSARAVSYSSQYQSW